MRLSVCVCVREGVREGGKEGERMSIKLVLQGKPVCFDYDVS